MISVIVPSFNYGHLVADTIASIQGQTYGNWEMIIVDDGSSDNTEAIVNERMAADPRIRFFKQANAGPSAARNLALREAKGDFIQFLDADDLLEPGSWPSNWLFLKKCRKQILYTDLFAISPETPPMKPTGCIPTGDQIRNGCRK